MNLLLRNVLVWKESIRNYYQMLASEGWEEKNFVHTPVINSLTSKVGRRHHRKSLRRKVSHICILSPH
jgi:hypothetical protein